MREAAPFVSQEYYRLPRRVNRFGSGSVWIPQFFRAGTPHPAPYHTGSMRKHSGDFNQTAFQIVQESTRTGPKARKRAGAPEEPRRRAPGPPRGA